MLLKYETDALLIPILQLKQNSCCSGIGDIELHSLVLCPIFQTWLAGGYGDLMKYLFHLALLCLHILLALLGVLPGLNIVLIQFGSLG